MLEKSILLALIYAEQNNIKQDLSLLSKTPIIILPRHIKGFISDFLDETQLTSTASMVAFLNIYLYAWKIHLCR